MSDDLIGLIVTRMVRPVTRADDALLQEKTTKLVTVSFVPKVIISRVWTATGMKR